jgi:deazaflavin-dependent oxidoreductase (nitroreductase family)
MPAPYAIARLARDSINHLTRPLAGHLPPFILVDHRGRTSGRRYQTPMFGFFDDGAAVVVVLTYGPNVDWLKNLQATGGGIVHARGRVYQVGAPAVEAGLGRANAIPAILRPFLRTMRVNDFARLPIRASALAA